MNKVSEIKITKRSLLHEICNEKCHNWYYFIRGRIYDEQKTCYRKFAFIVFFDVFDVLEELDGDTYTKADIEENGHFPIYIEKGIGDEFDVYPFTDNNVCKQIAYIKYVHELQHLLFGLSINHEMEV